MKLSMDSGITQNVVLRSPHLRHQENATQRKNESFQSSSHAYISNAESDQSLIISPTHRHHYNSTHRRNNHHRETTTSFHHHHSSLSPISRLTPAKMHSSRINERPQETKMSSRLNHDSFRGERHNQIPKEHAGHKKMQNSHTHREAGSSGMEFNNDPRLPHHSHLQVHGSHHHSARHQTHRHYYYESPSFPQRYEFSH